MFNKETSEAIDLLKKMICIPSFSREERECADLLEMYILEKGYKPSRNGNNIWIFIGIYAIIRRIYDISLAVWSP